MNMKDFMKEQEKIILGATSPERLAFYLGEAIGQLCNYAGKIEGLTTKDFLSMHDKLFLIAKGRAEKKEWDLDIF